MASNREILYRVPRKVVASGPPGRQCLIISLPKVWADAHGIKPGQIVHAIFDNFRGLLIVPAESSGEAKAAVEKGSGVHGSASEPTATENQGLVRRPPPGKAIAAEDAEI